MVKMAWPILAEFGGSFFSCVNKLNPLLVKNKAYLILLDQDYSCLSMLLVIKATPSQFYKSEASVSDIVLCEL